MRPDELDRILNEAKKHIDDGVFHEHVAADFHATPDEQKPRIIAAFYRDVVDDRKDSASKDAIEKVLELLQRRKDWHELRSQAIRMLMRDAADPLCDEAVRTLAEKAMNVARQAMN